MTTPDLPQISDERIDAVTLAQWGEMHGHPLAAHRAYARAIIAEVNAQWLARLGAVAEGRECPSCDGQGFTEEGEISRVECAHCEGTGKLDECGRPFAGVRILNALEAKE